MRRHLLTTALVVVLLGSSACGGSDAPAAGPGRTSPSSSDGSTSSAPVPDDPRRAAVDQLLERRARATVQRDRAAFLAGVGGSGRAAQAAWFERYRQLPLESVSYDVGMPDVSVQDPDRFAAEVEERVQLQRFDDAPVSTEHQMQFRRIGGRWRVVADHFDREQIAQAPWDVPGTHTFFLGPIGVVTDDGSQDQVPSLVASADVALRQIRRLVPGGLDGAVVLAFADPSTLRIEGLPRGRVAHAAGLSIDVLDADGDPAGRRVALSPVELEQPAAAVQHELRRQFTGVALRHLSHVPTWVAEGIGEYTAWLPEPRLYVRPEVVDAARQGIDAMPQDFDFQRDSDVSFGIAWWSLMWLRQEYDATEPYQLVKALDDAKAVRFDDVDAVLEDRYGLSADELAVKAGALIRAGYPEAPSA